MSYFSVGCENSVIKEAHHFRILGQEQVRIHFLTVGCDWINHRGLWNNSGNGEKVMEWDIFQNAPSLELYLVKQSVGKAKEPYDLNT